MGNASFITVTDPNYRVGTSGGTGDVPTGHAGFIVTDGSGNATYYEYGLYKQDKFTNVDSVSSWNRNGAIRSLALTGLQYDSSGNVDTVGNGDVLYATAAYQGIAQPASFYGQVIRNSWAATGANFSQSNTVAVSHLTKHIDHITNPPASSGSYGLPTTTQIERSYYSALESNNVTPYAAVDLDLAATFGSSNGSGTLLGVGTNWYNMPGGMHDRTAYLSRPVRRLERERGAGI